MLTAYIAGGYAVSVLLTYVLLYYNQQFKLKKNQLELSSVEDKIDLLKEAIEMPAINAASSDAEFLQIYTQAEKAKLQALMKRSEELNLAIQPLKGNPGYLFAFSILSPVVLPTLVGWKIGRGVNFFIKYLAERAAQKAIA